jgi:NAD(P)-dependent dehydrogenase (short-subunit alcohol dehydrogenase family)
MTKRLDGRIALVFGGGTGGTGIGNGKAASILMAREGAAIMVADINLDAAKETCQAIAQEGGRALPIACDVKKPADIAAVVKACTTEFGGIDILLNNVGVGGGGLGLFAHEEDKWDEVFAINVRSVFTAARHTVPIMLERGGGRIVNISSTAGQRIIGGSISPAYAASKAAVIMLTRTIAIEFAPKGVRCNCVVPGSIDTPHASGAIRRSMAPEDAERIIAKRRAISPTGDQGTAWDIGNAVLYLVIPESGFVNGAELVVDGGYTWTTPPW